MNVRVEIFARLLLVTLAAAAACDWGTGRFAIGIDGQQVRCLPWTAFLIDRSRTAPQRLAFVAFRARGLAPLIADGTVLVKQVIGVPGDLVQVREGRYRVNGVDRGRIDPTLVARVGTPAGGDGRAHALAAGEYAVLGQHPASFDSRYFGAVRRSQLIGEATPLW